MSLKLLQERDARAATFIERDQDGALCSGEGGKDKCNDLTGLKDVINQLAVVFRASIRSRVVRHLHIAISFRNFHMSSSIHNSSLH